MYKIFGTLLLSIILSNLLFAQGEPDINVLKNIFEKINLRISAGYNYSSFGGFMLDENIGSHYDYGTGYKIGFGFTPCESSRFKCNASFFYSRLKSTAYDLPGRIIYDDREELSRYDLYFESSFLEFPVNLEFTFLKWKNFNFNLSAGLSLVVAWEDYSNSKNYRETGIILLYYPENYTHPVDYIFEDTFFTENSGSNYNISLGLNYKHYLISFNFEDYLVKFKNINFLHSYSIIIGYQF